MYCEELIKAREAIEYKKACEEYARLLKLTGGSDIIKEWSEDKHPRGEDGRFVTTGGSDEENRRILREKVANGDITLTINRSMQRTHMFDTRVEGKSYFMREVTYDVLQTIVKERYATGKVRITRSGQIKEVISYDRDIARNVDYSDGSESDTNRITIHYSKKRTHISPAPKISGTKKAGKISKMDKAVILGKFNFKYVNIVDIYGNEYKHWYVDVYDAYSDNDGIEEEGIGIDEIKGVNSGVYLFRSEIVSIELAQ